MPPGYGPAPVAQGPWPRSYQGPLPPNVVPQMPAQPYMPVMPTGYYPPPAAQYYNPAMDRHARTIGSARP